MFEAIKKGVTPQQASELFLNDYIVLLIEENIKKNSTGDIIFVGSISERRVFIKNKTPPNGYTFFMLRGNNLREYCPIIEEAPCYSS